MIMPVTYVRGRVKILVTMVTKIVKMLQKHMVTLILFRTRKQCTSTIIGVHFLPSHKNVVAMAKEIVKMLHR